MIVGTAGHIDHGKTALVAALTGVDTDRLKEEKARGISIDLGFAYLAAPDGGVLGFVDVPGHERFLRNMLAGFVAIDLALVVVACDDGVMPQTVEHLAIIDLLGVERGLVALTKTDLVGPARINEVRQEIAALIAGSRLAGADILAVSGATGEGIAALRAHLFAAADTMPAHRGARAPFRLPVDRCFTLAGVGTVVTGTLVSGTVAVGDTVTLSPSGLSARVRSIHAQNRPAGRGVAGERCALSLAGPKISRQAVGRGDVVLDPALHAPSRRIDASLRVLKSEAGPPGQWMPVRLHHGAAEVGARIALLGDPPAPGTEALVQLVLEKPLAALAGDRFIVRDTSARRTIGGGRLIDLRAPARRRRTPERLARLAALALPEPQAALEALLKVPPRHVDLTAFARDRGLDAERLDDIAGRLGLVVIGAGDASIGLSPAAWEETAEAAVAGLRAFHATNSRARGMAPEALRKAVAERLGQAAFAGALRLMARQGRLAVDGAHVRLADHRVGPTAEDESLWGRIAPLLAADARFRPPRAREIAAALDLAESETRRLLKAMEREGRVIEVAPDHYFLHAAMVEMVAIAADIAAASADGGFVAAQFRDRLDNGRKVAIRILEFFDRVGVTLRRGDVRMMNPHRGARFAPADGGQKTVSGRESSPVGRPDFKSAGGP